MSELHVGGLFKKPKYKTLRDAIAHAQSGDTIIVHKRDNDLTDKGGILINKPLYIEGQDEHVKIKVAPHQTGFMLKAGNVLSLKNLVFEVPNQANALAVAQEYQGSIMLDHIKTQHLMNVKPREMYPSVSIQTKCHVSIQNCDIDMLNLQNIMLKDCTHSVLGSLLSNRSMIVPSYCCRLDHCELNNLQFASMSQDMMLRLDTCATEGSLHLLGRAEADNFVFRGLMAGSKNRELNKRINIWKQYFKETDMNPVGLSPNVYDLIVTGSKWVKQGSLVLSNPSFVTKLSYFKEHEDDKNFDDSMTFVQQRSWFDFVNSDIQIMDAVIPASTLPNQINNSDIQLIDTKDKSRWSMNKATVSNKNSESSLFVNANASNPQAKEQTALEELDSMIGLDNVKQFVHQQVAKAKVQMERKKRGLDVDAKDSKGSLHMVFGGSAGTGKTTISRIVAKALYEEGVLKENKLTEAGAEDMVAKFVGQTMPKTHELIMKSLDGVLLIDEAYQLAPQGGNSFNDEAVTQLIKDAENYRDRLVVILAGYETDMRHFFQVGNEGLKSRFTNWIEFPDYSDDDLVQILDFHMKKNHLQFDEELTHQCAYQGLLQYVHIAKRGSGNGRAVRTFLEKMAAYRDTRLNKLNFDDIDDEMFNTFILDDVKQATISCCTQMKKVEGQ